ncbi:MAG: anti-sigma factor family protein [Pyrinomonadaceae bacterium]
MQNSDFKINPGCSPELLHEFLDGELSPQQESLLNDHLLSCANCSSELNIHKAVFGKADELSNGVEVPPNFAEAVATKADSQINGLRRRKERVATLTVAVLLAFSTVSLIGFDISRSLAAAEVLATKAISFISMLASFLANFAIGIYVILRVIFQQIDSVALFVTVAAICLSLCFFWLLKTAKRSVLGESKR